MRCYFIRNDHVVVVDMLPPGLWTKTQSLRHTSYLQSARGRLTASRCWDGARLVISIRPRVRRLSNDGRVRARFRSRHNQRLPNHRPQIVRHLFEPIRLGDEHASDLRPR